MVDFKALAAPFPPEEVSWRLGSTSKEKMKGMALAYLDARAVMDRLDAVCGPAGWQCKYSHANGKTVCDIGINLYAGKAQTNTDGSISPIEQWIWKADGAGDSDIEAEKGALSDAFKRAAVRWGIGRYLYSLESPWVEIEEWGRSFRIKRGAYKELDMVLRRATLAILEPPPSAATGPSKALAAAKDDIARQQNADKKPSSILSTMLTAIGMAGSYEDLSAWWKENKEQIESLSEKDYDKVLEAAEDRRDALKAKVAA